MAGSCALEPEPRREDHAARVHALRAGDRAERRIGIGARRKVQVERGVRIAWIEVVERIESLDLQFQNPLFAPEPEVLGEGQVHVEYSRAVEQRRRRVADAQRCGRRQGKVSLVERVLQARIGRCRWILPGGEVHVGNIVRIHLAAERDAAGWSPGPVANWSTHRRTTNRQRTAIENRAVAVEAPVAKYMSGKRVIPPLAEVGKIVSEIEVHGVWAAGHVLVQLVRNPLVTLIEDGLRPGVIDAELQALAVTLVERSLQRVVIGFSDECVGIDAAKPRIPASKSPDQVRGVECTGATTAACGIEVFLDGAARGRPGC